LCWMKAAGELRLTMCVQYCKAMYDQQGTQKGTW